MDIKGNNDLYKLSLFEWCCNNEYVGNKLIQEWVGYDDNGVHHEMNELTPGSRRKMLWRCSNRLCNHEWYSMIYNRTTLLNGCPACNGKVVNNVNSFYNWCINNDRKRLIYEWTGIGIDGKEYDIHKVTYGSHKKILWRCSNKKCNHEWYAVIKSRTLLSSNCPACAGQVATEENNLEKWCIENKAYGAVLRNEWCGVDIDGNEITMHNIARASSRKVLWRCINGHTWYADVKHRTLVNEGCPHCAKSRQTSYPEQFLYEGIKCIYSNAEHRVRVLKDKYSGGIEFDIGVVLDEEKHGYKAVCIEYSPTYWHSESLEHDKLKVDICKKYNVRLIQIVEDTDNELEHTISEDYICFHMNYSKQDEILFNILKFIINTLGESSSELNINELRRKAIANSQSIDYKDSIEYHYPKLAEEFNCTLNNITPDKISRASSKRMYWTCPDCGYGSNGEWFIAPVERTRQNRMTRCKICRRKWW